MQRLRDTKGSGIFQGPLSNSVTVGEVAFGRREGCQALESGLWDWIM